MTLVDPPNHCMELYADHCELSGVTVHECARQCSVQFSDCVSFDFREAHP